MNAVLAKLGSRLALMLVIVCAVSGHAIAQTNLLSNGSFESGTTGWTIGSGSCAWASLAAGATTTQAGGFAAPSAILGTQSLLSDSDSIQTCTMYQDVSVPAGVTQATLGGAAGYNYNDYLDPTGAGCTAAFAVTTTGGVSIAPIYSASGGTNAPLATFAPVPFAIPAGTTVLRLVATTVSCEGGPAGIVVCVQPFHIEWEAVGK